MILSLVAMVLVRVGDAKDSDHVWKDATPSHLDLDFGPLCLNTSYDGVHPSTLCGGIWPIISSIDVPMKLL